MIRLADYPLLVFVLSFFCLWLSSLIGATMRRRRGPIDDGAGEDFGVILTATLTLLGLIIGSASRWRSPLRSAQELRRGRGQRDRHGIRPRRSAARSPTRRKCEHCSKLPRSAHLVLYDARWASNFAQINTRTAELQTDLWSRRPGSGSRAADTRDCAGRRGNERCPELAGIHPGRLVEPDSRSAWWLMGAIAICSNLLVGYGVRSAESGRPPPLVVPLVVAISFMLIADIDSPRGGVIRVSPENLLNLSASLHGQ